MHVHLADYRIYPEYWLDGIKNSIVGSMRENDNTDIPDIILKNIIQNSLKDFDGSKLIAQMDEAGIDKSVVLLADLGFNKEDNKLDIEELYRVHYEVFSRFKDRLIIFGGIDPARGKKGLEVFEKGIKEYGFKGLKLYPPCGFDLNDRSLHPIYEMCEHYDLPVLAHIGPSLPSMRSSFDYPSSILEAAKNFKKIPFILGHAAIMYFTESYMLPLQRENIYLEISGFQQNIKDESDMSQKLKKLFEVCPENILFGTDWPLFNNKGSQKVWVKYFKELDYLTEKQKELLLYENALGILKI